MRWKSGRRSSNVEDRRDMRVSRRAGVRMGGESAPRTQQTNYQPSAHEVGHHVQNLLGISRKVHEARSRMSREQGNELSVRQELQADCLADVWANHADKARNILEAGDIAEALRAASMIGDDRLQKQSQGYIVPESFTHGSSEQRMRWFQRGIDSGRPGDCDTFKAARL